MKFDREKIKTPDCDAVWIADDLFLASEPSRALERSAAFPLEKQPASICAVASRA